MVLHCMDQLVTQDVVLCMLMTSDQFRFYRSMKKMKTILNSYICDGFRALAAVSPGCLATVVKSHRTWIPPLCFHPPTQCNANGGPQSSHLNPPSNGMSAPARALRMCAPPKFSIKAVHATRGSLLVSRWLSHI